MSYKESEFFKAILNYYENNNWRGILSLNEKSNIQEAVKILWVWPSEDDINFIQDVVVNNRLKGISSIGCGCGLLEWILQQSTGLEIEGFEVNRQWWESKYSFPPFIPLKFPSFPLIEGVLDPKYALLFCYFNNGSAFQEYVENFGGTLIIIIGPSHEKGTHTDPQPFEAKFPTSDWLLKCFKEIKQTKDFIACYIRDRHY